MVANSPTALAHSVVPIPRWQTAESVLRPGQFFCQQQDDHIDNEQVEDLSVADSTLREAMDRRERVTDPGGA